MLGRWKNSYQIVSLHAGDERNKIVSVPIQAVCEKDALARQYLYLKMMEEIEQSLYQLKLFCEIGEKLDTFQIVSTHLGKE